MLISEFSRLTGLPRETVRFYVRLGMLQPASSMKGGRNPYRLFTEEDVQLAELIRISQALGMSLKEITVLIQVRREGRASPERSIEVLTGRLVHVEDRIRQFESMADYLRAKIEWLRAGSGTEPGEPNFNAFVEGDSIAKTAKAGQSR